MSVWKEIRCDHLSPAENCFSYSNNGPKGFVSVAELHAAAREDGWSISRHGAICPNCRIEAYTTARDVMKRRSSALKELAK